MCPKADSQHIWLWLKTQYIPYGRNCICNSVGNFWNSEKKQEQQSDSTSICSLTTFNNPLWIFQTYRIRFLSHTNPESPHCSPLSLIAALIFGRRAYNFIIYLKYSLATTISSCIVHYIEKNPISKIEALKFYPKHTTSKETSGRLFLGLESKQA